MATVSGLFVSPERGSGRSEARERVTAVAGHGLEGCADVQQWPVGQRVQVGGALLEITMVCDPCSRMDELRAGLRAEIDGKRGMLAHVVEGGEIALGDAIELL